MDNDSAIATEFSALILFGLGTFLILDSLFFHTITFQYSAFGLQGSPYFHHAFWGLLMVGLAIWLFFVARRGQHG